MNKVDNAEQLSRMKSLMNYGLKTEGKEMSYSSIEYQKLGADGKVYGIIREGSKYYIKSADDKKNLVKEDFNYIGGFRNRKDNEYNSFANAQKNFDLKLRSINEAMGNRNFSVESWDLDKKENVVVEASAKMQNEILRERQIMKNVAAINEKKEIDQSICDSQKDNMKCDAHETGEAKDGVFDQKSELPKEMTEQKVNEEEVLGWHDSNGNPKNDHYMDTSHGTEIGSSMPFDDAKGKQIDGQGGTSETGELKDGTVEEGVSMHDTDDQNKPAPGTGEVGDNNPFDGEKGKQIDEALDIDDEIDDADVEGGDDVDLDGELDTTGEDPLGAEDGLGDEEDLAGAEDDLAGAEDDLAGAEEDEDVYEDDVESRLGALEDIIQQIADKLGVGTPAVDADSYEEDDLYGGEGEDDFGDEEDFGGEDDLDDEEPIEDEFDMEPTMAESRKNVRIFESPGYRRLKNQRRLNEDDMKAFSDAGRVPAGNINKLNVYGKHPAYQKKVMELPPKDFTEKPGNYDMNDDSVKNDAPYGEKIGSSYPFTITPDKINNAISETLIRHGLKKK